MAILYFLLIIFFLLVHIKLASEFHNIAIIKGYDEVKYFWYCFLFGIIGYMLIIALPDSSEEKDNINNTLPEI